ncbi:hypothetical protein [Candidatus Methylobacter oryzae]|uniref:Uncharacterized protein n=1 Tax=Candidatus Methylobacter oryzae TaxID=2497749 RepID=A0ABY3CC18_9GAMM|nr:hypothetical protein [Candidatus Methylobacter oryzae]TRW95543.1 hypothetical protein EKO24_009830 [Candidatus Methylobacter oryzae]
MPKSEWRNSSAWIRENHGSVFKLVDNIIEIPTGTQPNSLFHGWNTVWPRPKAADKQSYYLEAEVLATDDGMFQMGVNFYKNPTRVPVPDTKIQAAVSKWICADPSNSSRWVTVRTPFPSH